MVAFRDGITGQRNFDAVTSGYRWIVGEDHTIRWALAGSASAGEWQNPDATAARFQAVLDIISRFTALKFEYVGSFATATAAQTSENLMTFVLDDGGARPPGSGMVRAYAPGGDVGPYANAGGDIHLNYLDPNLYDPYQLGSTRFVELMQDVLHALGLKDLLDSAGGARPTSLMLFDSYVGSSYSTLMSEGDGFYWGPLVLRATTPMLMDVLALQRLYGKNMETNAGDDTYALSRSPVMRTNWDAAGHDTLTVSADTTGGWKIVLSDTFIWQPETARAGYASPLEPSGQINPRAVYWLVGDYEDIVGSPFADQLYGNPSDNSIYGGAGDDIISGGGSGSDFLRGEDGNDSVQGGSRFDDLHGNKGEDTVYGYGDGDWVVGGQGNDLLVGMQDSDVVLGNLGNDLCYGDSPESWTELLQNDPGNDVVRGGQGDDLVYGNRGDDWLSGDRGSDTITGGLGADLFHTFDGAGLDVVTDFNRGEGDRVYVLPGTHYTVSQVGADVVIEVEGGTGRMVLQNVQLSSLTGEWIFGA